MMVVEPVRVKRSEFLARAGEAFDRMFGSDGQNGLVTFAEREERACEVSDELARWLMAEHIALDPTGAGSVERACPICGGPVRYETAEAAEQELREFQTRRGKIEYRRAGCRCPRCRRIFFGSSSFPLVDEDLKKGPTSALTMGCQDSLSGRRLSHVCARDPRVVRL